MHICTYVRIRMYVCTLILLVSLTHLVDLHFFLHRVSQNKLKQKNYLPQRQIMSLAEKADTAAVSFCLNNIFFLTAHMEKVL